MSDLYLIAHKVRGEPAFDVATRMICPMCNGRGALYTDEGSDVMCHECEADGYWWIIPTSGHRAYPYWDWNLDHLGIGENMSSIPELVTTMPPDLPDHYQHREAPKVSLIDALGLKPKPLPPIVRRL